MSDRAAATRALEHELGVLTRRVRRALATRAQLVHPELTPAAYSMLRLLEKGPRRSSELAEVFALDKGAVSRQVGMLESLDLLERQPDPDDGRAQLLSLTDLARERLTSVDQVRRERYEQQLQGWSGEEIEDLAAVLARYNASLA